MITQNAFALRGLALSLASVLLCASAAQTLTPAVKAGIEWIPIPGGSFIMGYGALDAWPWTKPAHRVTVPSFQMAKTAATFKQYKACVNASVCTPAHVSDGTCYAYDVNGANWGQRDLPAGFRGDDQPAVCLTWRQSRTFAQWVGGRLPTEAEYEYAARSAGKEYLYPWGNAATTCERAVIGGCGGRATMPVCSKPRGNTEQGLCDMSGNSWTFVQDEYHFSYAGAPADGSAWGSPTRGGAPQDFCRAGRGDGSAWKKPNPMNPVMRGGSWRMTVGFDRSAFRAPIIAGCRYSTGGIRPVRSRP
jgi:formylglycine-generating enzyme required for sulfatase activity